MLPLRFASQQQQQAGGAVLAACQALQRSLLDSLKAGSHGQPGAAAAVAAAAATQQLQQRRGKRTSRMVLLKDHPTLGRRGDLVEVAAGHARHTLFPRGEADYAIPSVLRELQARGVLTPEALEQLQRGPQQAGEAARVDLSALPLEQQLPRVMELLGNKPLVVARRFNLADPEQGMVGQVTARHLAAAAFKQLKVLLPPELVLMQRQAPITSFGSFRVPLNLRNERGEQVELPVVVERTRRASGVRASNQRFGLLRERQRQQQQQQQAAGGAAAQA